MRMPDIKLYFIAAWRHLNYVWPSVSPIHNMTHTTFTLARRLVLVLATGAVAAPLSGCMALAAMTSIPAEIRTMVNPEHVWIETRIELEPKAVVRSITECENDTKFSAAAGTQTHSRPVAKDARTRYAVYTVKSVNYVVAHHPICWNGAESPAPKRVAVGVLEKSAVGWVIREPINTATGPSADKQLTRWSLSVKHKELMALRGDEVAANSELTALLTNAVANGTLIAPPIILVHGVAPTKDSLPNVELAENISGTPDVRCWRQFECRFSNFLFSEVRPSAQYPGALHATRWQIDLSTPSLVRVLYLQGPMDLQQRALELSGIELDLRRLFDGRPAWSSIFGRDNLKGYYFELRRSQATVPFSWVH